jgi:hypothetical protein
MQAQCLSCCCEDGEQKKSSHRALQSTASSTHHQHSPTNDACTGAPAAALRSWCPC